MQNLITVIVPVYNVEEYLERCINSILSQTYKNLEIILVDDGSTDNCGSICDNYKNIDQRIRVIHKKNGGLSEARNYGIDAARGKYITFIDSDDLVTRYYVENLYNAIEKTGADISMSGLGDWYDGDKYIDEVKCEKTEILSQLQCMEKILYQDFLDVCAPGKMYKANLFDDIRFPAGKLYEDVPTIWAVLKKIKYGVVAYTIDYMYYQRKSGIQRSNFNLKKIECIKHWDLVRDDVERLYPGLIPACYCRCFSAAFNILFQISGHEYKDIQNELWADIKNYRSTVIKDKKARKKAKYAAYISFLGSKITKYLYKIVIGK